MRRSVNLSERKIEALTHLFLCHTIAIQAPYASVSAAAALVSAQDVQLQRGILYGQFPESGVILVIKPEHTVPPTISICTRLTSRVSSSDLRPFRLLSSYGSIYLASTMSSVAISRGPATPSTPCDFTRFDPATTGEDELFC